MSHSVTIWLMAFGQEGETRKVELPEEDFSKSLPEFLERFYYWGQNDFQPQDHPSVSCGDVIEREGNPFGGGWYLVCGAGFREISLQEFIQLGYLPRRDRSFWAMEQEANI